MVEIRPAKWYNGCIFETEATILFGRKKKRKDSALFGRSIEPDCAYCAHSVQAQGNLKCRLGQTPGQARCKRYAYDPLRREPKGEPKLAQFSAEDFKL